MQGNVVYQVGSAIDRIKCPGQILGAPGRAFFLTEEGYGRCVLFKLCANGALVGDIWGTSGPSEDGIRMDDSPEADAKKS